MTTRRHRIARVPREEAVRRLFRQTGFRVESVSFIRARDEEFMAIHCYPQQDVAEVVQLLTDPRSADLEITRIHSGTSAARVYVRFTDSARLPALTWDQMDAAIKALEIQ